MRRASSHQDAVFQRCWAACSPGWKGGMFIGSDGLRGGRTWRQAVCAGSVAGRYS
ncbi:hypothetical protein Tchl_1119 [Thauera chlorobenzoica]|uniref:Uncharacterized protein n=1 Tax=Thauera chlorobenzoica TaxID=96773 RepID=A0A1L6FAP3_9RHOO|nr:hypothetical protein Tchl_1119 [Thauera chlorobenzoica]